MVDFEFDNPAFDPGDVDDDYVDDETPLVDPADDIWEVPNATPS